MSEEGNWHECICDHDYEINDAFPYPIRKKGKDKIIKEFIDNNGYICCALNNRKYLKHRIIGSQFIDNDDPENKTVIDHIDHNKNNNHISNLIWTTQQQNLRNRSSLKGRHFIYHDELPDTAEPLDSYSGHDLDGVFVDFENQKVYKFNGIKYRELTACQNGGCIYYWVLDIENKQVHLCHKVLFH